MTYGWAVATICGLSYNSYDGNHAHVSWPTAVTRGYLGQPVAEPVLSGNTLSRQFQHGTVTANFTTRTGVFGTSTTPLPPSAVTLPTITAA